MKYAVIEIQSRQYLVKPDSDLVLDRLEGKEGSKIKLDKVLLIVDQNGEVKVGKPYLEGVALEATIKAHNKGKKIRVATYKAKSRYRRVLGFRPSLTELEIKGLAKKTAKKTN